MQAQVYPEPLDHQRLLVWPVRWLRGQRIARIAAGALVRLLSKHTATASGSILPLCRNTCGPRGHMRNVLIS